jgi:hypothetical protein
MEGSHGSLAVPRDPVRMPLETMGQFGPKMIVFLALAGSCLAGCAENTYLYRPAQQATARVSGLPAARYAIPPEKPQGEVLVVSTGVTEIKPNNVPGRALFARVIVTNNSDDTAWQLDTRKQAAVFANDRIPPQYVNTFGQALPIIEIPKGEKRTIDFYFPVPAGMETNGDLPQFDLSWNVDTGTRSIAERTVFDRFRVETYGPPYGYYGYPYGYPYPYGWGWYGPYYGPYDGPYWGASIYYGGGWGYGGYYGHPGYYGHGGYYGGGGGHGSYSRPHR